MSGNFDQRVPWKPGVEALGREDDPAVRVAQGDRDRVATAHQDALDEGLAAVGVGGHARQVYRRARGRGRWSGTCERSGSRARRAIGRPDGGRDRGI